MPSARESSPEDISDGGVDLKYLAIGEAKKAKKEKKEKSEKGEKKVKKEKKEKKESSKDKSSTKEKSSKKRKAETLTEEPVVAKSSEDDVSMEAASPVQEEPSDNPPSKKRKSVLGEEIEVDVTAPEPPSKKALRALKKGKPLPPSRSGAEPMKDGEAKKPKAEVEKRSEHAIWIGNLAFHTSKTDLRKFFVEKSDITDEMLTRIHMPGPNDKKSANSVEEKRNGKTVHNKGFAYVDFTTEAGVTEALELSEQLLGGRRVLIKNHKSFEGRPQKTKEETRKEGKPPSKRVFVGNLAFEATEESVQEHFEKCGAIQSVKLAQFEDSGKCKGYGWIQFEELEAAQNAERGFFHVDESASDSESDSEADSDSEMGSDAESTTKPKPKTTIRRKVWCNRINGRTLRMEFAEDAQVRYKKRYGKDGTKQQQQPQQPAGESAPESNVVVPSKTVEYRKPYAARLTGGIIESKGKKVTF
ncbi:hypothetical protein HYFRA_00009864 [Hymenoscyphus fraxineus]|uniref:RRM domain-containing protein n=1 Tax=Hymenoscyphus fraxineus TaxID=746836 RepID=A0A9N9L5K3_9HELO|nr:hypothetical protein HYFRA_00009864 [Hymenoscyphus fraxineus]